MTYGSKYGAVYHVHDNICDVYGTQKDFEIGKDFVTVPVDSVDFKLMKKL